MIRTITAPKCYRKCCPCLKIRPWMDPGVGSSLRIKNVVWAPFHRIAVCIMLSGSMSAPKKTPAGRTGRKGASTTAAADPPSLAVTRGRRLSAGEKGKRAAEEEVDDELLEALGPTPGSSRQTAGPYLEPYLLMQHADPSTSRYKNRYCLLVRTLQETSRRIWWH